MINIEFLTEDKVHFVLSVGLDVPTGSYGPSFYLVCMFVIQVFLGYSTSRQEYANSDTHPYLEKALSGKFCDNKLSPCKFFARKLILYTLLVDGVLLLIHVLIREIDIPLFQQYNVLFGSFTLVWILLFDILILWLPFYFANFESTYYSFPTNIVVALFQIFMFTIIHPVPFLDWYRMIY
ncbi:MAG: hypothetical protein INQ03_08335 [Candidatus Heimdallarchaeota archaeon]|nr:hypothetical protein [Candidatus Heimdallarchaeota archaeon]